MIDLGKRRKPLPYHMRKKLPVDNLCKIVIDSLIEPWEHKKFTIYMDNYYTSIPLFDDMLKRGKRCCGTLRPNRISKLPPYHRPKIGDFVYFKSKVVPDLYAVYFHDVKPVFLISTRHAPLWMEIQTTNYRDETFM
mmetsp:Transcript_28997/g.26339  ORF Transcript_28997/g.26339 Transcript_28997/m.26339 type:complete len:136 (+) Transcript_28997:5587-5994(+)